MKQRGAGGRFLSDPNRPEKVAAGRAAVGRLQAGEPVGLITDKGQEALLETLAAAALVPETEIDKAAAHGTRLGHRRPITKLMQKMLQGLADGKQVEQIALELGSSRQNVNNRIAGARYSLDAATTKQAIAIAAAAGLVHAKRLPVYETRGRKTVFNARTRKRAEGDLTGRELEVVALAADGLTDPEIGGRLDISVDTVRDHMKHALSKLGARNRTGAVATSLRSGLIQ